jgi:hypothetical protein
MDAIIISELMENIMIDGTGNEERVGNCYGE